MAAPDYATLKLPRKVAAVELALGPIHVPKVYSDPVATLDVSNKNSALITFRPVPRLGPPLRMMTVGGTLKWYGGDSYVRGGGAATGHEWHIYEFNAVDDGTYLASRGAEVTGGTTILDSGKTLQWTPGTAGTYAIELHLDDAVEGNGTATPLGFGVRFVKVFASGGFDLEGVPEIDGPNASLDGGVAARMVYRRPDNLSGRQDIAANQRFVMNRRHWYAAGGTAAFTEYLWKPNPPGFDPTYYAAEVALSGLAQDSSIREDARTHETAFTVETVQTVLQLLSVPTRTLGMTAPGDPRTVRAAPTFYNEALWQLLLSTHATYFPEEPFDGPGWVYRVSNLVASDAILALLTLHTNVCDYFDLALDQTATDTVPSVEGKIGSVGDYLRDIQTGRFGRLYFDCNSIIYAGPDHDLREDAFRPASVITLGADLYKAIRVTHARPQVGQVYIQSADTIEPSPETLVGPNTDEVVAFTPKTYEATYPTTPANGARREYKAARFFDQTALDGLAQRVHARDNADFPEIEVDLDMFPHLDVNQPLTIELDPRTEDPDLEWNGGNELEVYVTGYSNRVNVATGKWETTLRLREATG